MYCRRKKEYTYDFDRSFGRELGNIGNLDVQKFLGEIGRDGSRFGA